MIAGRRAGTGRKSGTTLPSACAAIRLGLRQMEGPRERAGARPRRNVTAAHMGLPPKAGGLRTV